MVSQCVQLSFDGKKCILLLCAWKLTFLSTPATYIAGIIICDVTSVMKSLLQGKIPMESVQFRCCMPVNMHHYDSKREEGLRVL